MTFDVDLMRELMFVLESRELSPRSTIILDIDPLAERLERPPALVCESLDALLNLGYIEGPGADGPGMWFFRKLTRKGVFFLQATRSPRDWEQMKRHFDLNDPLAQR